MTAAFYGSQVIRLQHRFGNRAFDQEFCDLVWRECHTMSDFGFQRLVDVFIGHRTANKSPLLADFREGRLNEEKAKFQNDLKKAVETFEHPAKHDGLKRYLAREYPGCKTLWEAVQVQVLRNKIDSADRGER